MCYIHVLLGFKISYFYIIHLHFIIFYFIFARMHFVDLKKQPNNNYTIINP